MRTIKVSGRATKLVALLKQARRGGLILESPEGREYLLAEIDGFSDEVERTRKNKRLAKMLGQRGAEEGAVELQEVKKQLGLN